MIKRAITSVPTKNQRAIPCANLKSALVYAERTDNDEPWETYEYCEHSKAPWFVLEIEVN